MASTSKRFDGEWITIDAKPYDYTFPVKRTALLLIDMQRDFLLVDGFGEIQGGDLESVQNSIAPTKKLLEACRRVGLAIFHTREGHTSDLSDLPSNKINRQIVAQEKLNMPRTMQIGEVGPMGKLLTRGEYGHDLIDDLAPIPGEVVIDKPGKGSFWNTSLLHKLKASGITHLLVSGVTTECCFATSIREANDRGFECCGIEEATAGYNDSFKCSSLEMLYWFNGLFGFVGNLQPLLNALNEFSPRLPGAITPPATPPTWDGDLRISSLQASYRCGLSPSTVIELLYEKIEAYSHQNEGVWIHRIDKDTMLEAAENLVTRFPDKSKLPPLYGVPFSIKDSLDVAGLSTTTACPPLAYIAAFSTPVYEKAIAEGAIFVGKTNLDQFATGLTGCRSPYGMPHSVFHNDYISGGSSSGSCVSVGAGLCSFSIGTDTAGSGRVPSALNGVVGFKPTRGLLSTVGLVPACLSLDCIAIIAKNVSDARLIWRLCEEYDVRDRYAKSPMGFERHVNSTGPQATSFKFGIPPAEALSTCAPVYRRMFDLAVRQLQGIGGELLSVDWSPFEKAGRLLYEGTLVSERLASLPDDWFEENRDELHPVLQDLFDEVTSRNSTAIQAYRDMQAKALYTRQAEHVFGYSATGVDVILVPTTVTHWTTKQVLEDPLRSNSILGEFTHCGNVLDLCAVATPAGEFPVTELSGKDGDVGTLPFGVTFLSRSLLDAETLDIARRFEESLSAS